MKKRIRTACDFAVRLSACLEASGVQTTPRNAHINVKYEDHSAPNINFDVAASIATKARSWQPDAIHLFRACLQTCPSQLESPQARLRCHVMMFAFCILETRIGRLFFAPDACAQALNRTAARAVRNFSSSTNSLTASSLGGSIPETLMSHRKGTSRSLPREHLARDGRSDE